MSYFEIMYICCLECDTRSQCTIIFNVCLIFWPPELSTFSNHALVSSFLVYKKKEKEKLVLLDCDQLWVKVKVDSLILNNFIFLCHLDFLIGYKQYPCDK